MWQTIIVTLVVALAVFMVARRLWSESKGDGCGSCGGCQAPPPSLEGDAGQNPCEHCQKKP